MSVDLEAKIHWLEALERIRTVKHQYFISLDKARWDDVVSCFTEDAVIDVGLGPKPVSARSPSYSRTSMSMRSNGGRTRQATR